jgi:F-type H+-transporting ATPase subunit delta
MVKTSSQVRRQAKRLLRWCMVGGQLSEDRARQAVQRIRESHRRGYISLLIEFQRLVKLEIATHTAAVESAFALPGDLQVRTRESLQKAYGPGTITKFRERPDLIGGMRIQVGCDVYDGSVRSKLALLERSLGIPSTRERETR